MGNILCVPKHNKRRQSADGATGGRVSKWISGKLRRPSSKEEPLPPPNESGEHACEVPTSQYPPESCNSSIVICSAAECVNESDDATIKQAVEKPVCQYCASKEIHYDSEYSTAEHEDELPTPLFEETNEYSIIHARTTPASPTPTSVATSRECLPSSSVISAVQLDYNVVEKEPFTTQTETKVCEEQQFELPQAPISPHDIKYTNIVLAQKKDDKLENNTVLPSNNNETTELPPESLNTFHSMHDLRINTTKEESPEPVTKRNCTERNLIDTIENTGEELKENCDKVGEVGSTTERAEVNEVKGSKNAFISTENVEKHLRTDVSVTSVNSAASITEYDTMSLAELLNSLKEETSTDETELEQLYINELNQSSRKDCINNTDLQSDIYAANSKVVMSENRHIGDASKQRLSKGSASKPRSKVRSNKTTKRNELKGVSNKKAKQMQKIAPDKSFYRINDDPTPICIKDALYNVSLYPEPKRKVSDFKIPMLPPLLPDVPIELTCNRKTHIYEIPNIARGESRKKVTCRQAENKGSEGGQSWASRSPVFEPPTQALGGWLLDMYGSVEKMRRSWVIPQCRQIETLKLEHDIYPGLWVCPDMRWRYNMDTHTERERNITNRRHHSDRPKTNTNNAVNKHHRHQKRKKARSKAKGGSLARWSKYDDISSLYEETSF